MTKQSATMFQAWGRKKSGDDRPVTNPATTVPARAQA